MENNIKTNNIISTPEITGNIGSCTTKSERIVTSSNLTRVKGYTIATNSCTGEVKQFDFFSLKLFPILVLAVCVTFVLYAIFKKPDNVTTHSF